MPTTVLAWYPVLKPGVSLPMGKSTIGEDFRNIEITIYEAVSRGHIHCRVGTLANAIILLPKNEVWTGNDRSGRVSSILRCNLLILSHTFYTTKELYSHECR